MKTDSTTRLVRACWSGSPVESNKSHSAVVRWGKQRVRERERVVWKEAGDEVGEWRRANAGLSTTWDRVG